MTLQGCAECGDLQPAEKEPLYNFPPLQAMPGVLCWAQQWPTPPAPRDHPAAPRATEGQTLGELHASDCPFLSSPSPGTNTSAGDRSQTLRPHPHFIQRRGRELFIKLTEAWLLWFFLPLQPCAVWLLGAVRASADSEVAGAEWCLSRNRKVFLN